jgi:hypothetical protein
MEGARRRQQFLEAGMGRGLESGLGVDPLTDRNMDTDSAPVDKCSAPVATVPAA